MMPQYQLPSVVVKFDNASVTSAGATMSFFRHEEDYRPDRALLTTRSGPQTAPLLTIGFDESPAGYSLVS